MTDKDNDSLNPGDALADALMKAEEAKAIKHEAESIARRLGLKRGRNHFGEMIREALGGNTG